MYPVIAQRCQRSCAWIARRARSHRHARIRFHIPRPPIINTAGLVGSAGPLASLIAAATLETCEFSFRGNRSLRRRAVVGCTERVKVERRLSNFWLSSV